MNLNWLESCALAFAIFNTRPAFTTFIKRPQERFINYGVHSSGRLQRDKNVCQGALKLFWRFLAKKSLKRLFWMGSFSYLSVHFKRIMTNLEDLAIHFHLWRAWEEKKNFLGGKLLQNSAEKQYITVYLKYCLFFIVPDSFRSSDTSLSNDIDGTVHAHLHGLLNIHHAAVLACMKIRWRVFGVYPAF